MSSQRSNLAHAGLGGWLPIAVFAILVYPSLLGWSELVILLPGILLVGLESTAAEPHGHLPKHFIQDVPNCYQVDAEGVTEGSILF